MKGCRKVKIHMHLEANSAEELRTTLAMLGAAYEAPVVYVKAEQAVAAEESKPVDTKTGAVVEEKKPRGKAKVDPAKEEPKVETKKEEPPAITFDETKNAIIDYLNDWSQVAPNDPDVRTKNLQPLLAALGAQKISGIDPARYGEVAGLIDEGRARLAEFKEQSSVEE